MAAALVLVPGWTLLMAQSSNSGTMRGRIAGSTSAVANVDSTADYDDNLLPVESRQWESVAELDSLANFAAPAASDPDPAEDEDQNDNPNASRGSADNGAPATGLSFSGLAPMHDVETVDGLSAQQGYRSGPRGAAGGGPNLRSSYSQSAVQSFRMLRYNFSAQSGGVGGTLEITSRSATDHLHGSAFLQLRDSAWAATNPFSMETHYRDRVVTSAPVKPSGSSLQLGGAMGMPLPGSWARRKQASFFISTELQLHDDHIVSTPALASFYSLTPIQLALLATRGVSSTATNSALDYLDSLSGTTARSSWRLLADLRADASLSAHDHVALTYSTHRMDAPAGAAAGQASDAVVARGRGSLGDSHVQVDAVSGSWKHTFSKRIDNDLRAQLARDLEYETPRSPLPQEPAIGPGGLVPQISIAPNGFAYGTPSSLGRSAYPDEQRIELGDTLQLRVGHNLLSLGADWSRIHDRIASLTAAEGSMLYDSSNINGHAGGLVDWITDFTFNVNAYPNGGCPSINATVHNFCFRSYTQSFGPSQTEFTTHEIAGFAEDELHIRQELIFTFGARYEYTLLPLPQGVNPTLDADVAALARAIGGATATFPEDRNNFGPRIAVTWSPRWRSHPNILTVHAGYGVFFGRTPGATIRAALVDTALPTTALHIRITPNTITDCPQVTATQQGFGYPCAYTSTPPAAVAQTTSTMLFSNRYREPAVQRATLLLESELGSRLHVRAGYSLALATQLPQSVDLNIAPSTAMGAFVLQGGDGHPGLHSGETFVVPLYAVRPIAQYGAVTALVSNANATYHAFTAEAEWRGDRSSGLHSLELRGSYTFSRSIDYGPQSSATPGLNGQFDPFRDGYDKGLSGLHFPQRFSGDLLYTLHLQRGPAEVQRAINGWHLAAIGTAGSGAPYSYQVFGGTRLTGGRETLNGSGGATYLPTVGRNTLHLSPSARVDLRINREFAAGSHIRLNFFAQAFNLWNIRNLSGVETRAFVLGTPAQAGQPTPLLFQDAAEIATEGLSTQPFGTPTSSTTGASRERQIELGVRMQF
jgi:hypothetical protein